MAPRPIVPMLSGALVLLFLARPALATTNVMVIVIDDVGVDLVAAYGEHPEPARTPTMDGLAARGVLFRNAWSNPICSSARATLLTGRYGFRTGIGAVLRADSDVPGLDPGVPTIPRALGSFWSSAAAGKWHLAVDHPGHHPLACGFRRHAGTLFNFGEGYDYSLWEKSVNGVTGDSTVYPTTDTTDEALLALRKMPEPWFLWVAYNAAHAPLHAPPEHLHTYELSGEPGDTPIPHHRAIVEALDTEIGRLLEKVDFAETTVLLVSDNGTPEARTTPPFVPHHAKGTMFEGGINVPLIVVGSAVEAPGRECSALVNTTDLFATVLDVAGVPGAAPDSVSMLPYLVDPAAAPQREFVYAERFRPGGPGPYTTNQQAARGTRYKLIRQKIIIQQPDRMYDLVLDPFEEVNLLGGGLDDEQQAAFDALDGVIEDARP